MRGFKVSRDPLLVEQFEDIVGLYMSPPEHALMLCCDEKSQVQALDRTAAKCFAPFGVTRYHATYQNDRSNDWQLHPIGS